MEQFIDNLKEEKRVQELQMGVGADEETAT
jgi:hypothetical protein